MGNGYGPSPSYVLSQELLTRMAVFITEAWRHMELFLKRRHIHVQCLLLFQSHDQAKDFARERWLHCRRFHSPQAARALGLSRRCSMASFLWMHEAISLLEWRL